jgi:hypothetical protein
MKMAMNNVQLYLTIGIPTLAILIGILMNTLQYSSFNARFNSQDAQFNSLEARMSSLETRFDARFNNLEVKFDTLIGKVIDVDNRVTRIEAKLDIR